MEPKLYSNKIGYHIPQQNKLKMKVGQSAQLPNDSSFGQNNSTNMNRYINNAIKQSVKADKYGLRPNVSNHAYGEDFNAQRNNSYQNLSSRNNYPQNNPNNPTSRTHSSRNSNLHMANGVQHGHSVGFVTSGIPDTNMQIKNSYGANY